MGIYGPVASLAFVQYTAPTTTSFAYNRYLYDLFDMNDNIIMLFFPFCFLFFSFFSPVVRARGRQTRTRGTTTSKRNALVSRRRLQQDTMQIFDVWSPTHSVYNSRNSHNTYIIFSLFQISTKWSRTGSENFVCVYVCHKILQAFCKSARSARHLCEQGFLQTIRNAFCLLLDFV